MPSICAKTFAPLMQPTSTTAMRVFIDGTPLPMMALINNWNLRQENNAVYEEKHGDS